MGYYTDSRMAQRLAERRGRLKRAIAQYVSGLEMDTAFVTERYYQSRASTYFTVEEKIQSFMHLLEQIAGQVDDVTTLADLDQVAKRLHYVDECVDAFQAGLYRRPRRRKRLHLYDFFNRLGGDTSKQPDACVSLAEAYQVLQLTDTATLREVTVAFRQYVKQYHPDTNGGDRCYESQLQKVVSAYQILKEHLK